MSGIRERAKEWINSKSDRKTITYEHAIIRDLLAELERVENSREAERMECEKLACTEIVDHIKAHFKLQEAPK